MSRLDSHSDQKPEPIAVLTTQLTKALLKQAGLAYHQRDRYHRVIKRGLEVRQPSRQGGVVLVEFALSLEELREIGVEQTHAEIKLALSRAKEVLEEAGLSVAYGGTTGMVLVASVAARKGA